MAELVQIRKCQEKKKNKASYVIIKGIKPPQKNKKENKRLEENQLILKAQNGDEESKSILLKKYEGLIKKIVNKYFVLLHVTGMDFNDLYVEGQLGFLKAIEKFDTTKGYMISTYATYCIRNYVLNAIRIQNELIKVSSREVNKKIKLSKKISSENLKGNNNLNEDLTFFKFDFISGDEKNFENTLFEQGSFDSVEEEYLTNLKQMNMQRILNECFNQLLPEEELVLKLLFGMNCKKYSLQKAADKMNITKEELKTLRTSGFKKIKKYLKSKNISSFQYF